MKHNPIPAWTYTRQYQKDKRRMLAAVDRVFRSGRVILGSEVDSFEKAFAAWCHRRYGIGVGSGTDALFLSLKALGVGPGDHVITVPNTAIPTVSAIVATGATPVFVDCTRDTLLMDPGKIEQAITKRTRVILPVHLNGQCADMDQICAIAKKHRIPILEDCAQASGATWRGKPAGSFGRVAAFSFYPTKPLGAYGDGGMVVTNDAKLANAVRSLRMYGTHGGRYYAYVSGYNSRLDAVQAAILRFKLKTFSSSLNTRVRLATTYLKRLQNTPITLPVTHKHASPAWYLFVCRHPRRNALIRYLNQHGILLSTHTYPVQTPIHRMRAYRFLGYKRGDFPVAERVAREVFALPLYPGLTREEQHRVITAVLAFFGT